MHKGRRQNFYAYIFFLQHMKFSSIYLRLYEHSNNENIARALLHCQRDCNTNYFDIFLYVRD